MSDHGNQNHFSQSRCSRLGARQRRGRAVRRAVAADLLGAARGKQSLTSLYKRLLDLLLEGKNEAEIHEALEKSDKFSFLQPAEKEEKTARKDFDQETKSAAFLRDALAGAVKCKICGGLIHVKSISIDHKDRKEDGGLGNVENAQITHPYCNTTVKY